MPLVLRLAVAIGTRAAVAATGRRGANVSVKDYRSYSFWLETCGDDLTPRPPLDDSVHVDVAIVGAGSEWWD